LNSFTASSASSALTWWLTAPYVTQSSSAARKTLMPRSGLERFQGIERRQAGRIVPTS